MNALAGLGRDGFELGQAAYRGDSEGLNRSDLGSVGILLQFRQLGNLLGAEIGPFATSMIAGGPVDGVGRRRFEPGATGRGTPASSRKSRVQTIAMPEASVCN